jgi:hypothetical protein
LRFTFVAAAYQASTPHSGGFARLASGAFYEAISLTTFYEIIKDDEPQITTFSVPREGGPRVRGFKGPRKDKIALIDDRVRSHHF